MTTPLGLGHAEADRAASARDMARLWRDAAPVLARYLPDTFDSEAVRSVLRAHGLIADDGTEELRGLGAWPRRLGATAIGYTPSRTRSCHGAPRRLWSWPHAARSSFLTPP